MTDGKRTRFSRLASSVDEMANAITHFMAGGLWIFCCGHYCSDFYTTEEEAIAAAKKWLMEVEK